MGTEKAILIVPAYNEEANIPLPVKSGLALLERGVISDFIVIDDGSKDRTADVVRALGAKVISQPKNTGKGDAFLRGVLYAAENSADFAIMCDADLKEPLTKKHIEAMLGPMRKDGRIGMVAYPDIEGRIRTGAIVSGERAIRMSKLGFLFKRKGDGSIGLRDSSRARWFCDGVRGFGLEPMLNAIIPGAAARFLSSDDVPAICKSDPWRLGKKKQQDEQVAAAKKIEERRAELAKLRILKASAGWKAAIQTKSPELRAMQVRKLRHETVCLRAVV